MPCKLNPDCSTSKNLENLEQSVGNLGEELHKKYNNLNEKVDKVDNKVDGLGFKIDKIDTCITKMSQTIHGDSEIGYNGMLKTQKETITKVKEIDDLVWINRVLRDFWKSVKKPVYWAILLGIGGFIVALIEIVKF